MNNLKDGRAANDEFQTANSGFQSGEQVRDLIEHRLRVPAIAEADLLRPRLNAAILNALKPGRLLQLDAPNGYGKTHALVRALAADSTLQVRWISLNSGDNAPSRFLSILAAAMDLAEGLPARGGTFDDHLALMLNARDRHRPDGNEVLVLDNVHHLTNPSVTGLLHQLVTHLPGGLSVAMASRLSLPFESHTLELQGNYTRLGPEALEFTRTETFDFFQTADSESPITSVALDHLYSLTEGWPTPLALYRRELALGTERHALYETPSVERFLRDTVLLPLSAPRVKSLRAMAELDTCCDELFFAVEPSVADSGMSPSEAAERGLPIKAIPGRGRWFRLNPLLQAWLRTPVMGGYVTRMLIASQWFEQRRQIPEALKYAVLAGSHDEVVRIASESTEALLLGQDTASLLSLRKNLPPELLEQSARLRIVYGWVHAIGGQFRQARQLLENFPVADREAQQARIHALEAFILRGEGYVQPALDTAEQALANNTLSTQAQLVTQIVRSSALCAAGRFAEARDANRAAARLAREAGDAGSEALSVYAHARIELGKGALRHAEQLLRTGLDTATQELSRPARVGETRLQLDLVLVLWHQGQLEEADRLLVNYTRHAEQARDIGLLLAMALRVLKCRTQGRLDDAFVWIGRAERTMHAWQVDEALYLPVLDALKASCWLLQGQFDSAEQAIRRLEPYLQQGRVPELFPMMPGLLDCLLVRADIARGDLLRARKRLDEVIQRHQGTMRWGLQLHIGLLDALLLESEKGLPAACKQLEGMVAKAGQEHFISPFAELATELAPLIRKSFHQLPPSDFVAALGELFQCQAAPEPVAALAEPISDREQGVLELIARGLSNQEIADRLHISLHTVKTHARRINAKLDVKSRTQAIVRARELGLL